MLAADALIGKAAVVLTAPAGSSASPQTYSKHIQTSTRGCSAQIVRKPTRGICWLCHIVGQCCLGRLTEGKTDECSQFFILYTVDREQFQNTIPF